MSAVFVSDRRQRNLGVRDGPATEFFVHVIRRGRLAVNNRVGDLAFGREFDARQHLVKMKHNITPDIGAAGRRHISEVEHFLHFGNEAPQGHNGFPARIGPVFVVESRVQLVAFREKAVQSGPGAGQIHGFQRLLRFLRSGKGRPQRKHKDPAKQAASQPWFFCFSVNACHLKYLRTSPACAAVAQLVYIATRNHAA